MKQDNPDSAPDIEAWRAIPEYEGLYEVSTLGNIRSLTRQTLGRWGKLKTTPGRSIKPYITRVGYARVDLCKTGKIKHYLVHRIVAQTFIPGIEGKSCINHKDADKINNRVENLEWCTHSENTQHALAKYGSFRRAKLESGGK